MELLIYTGNFGSGKTEIALNQAIHLARQGQKVILIDLDIVKPYFRSREVRLLLEREGVNLIAPQDALSHADLPIVTPAVTGALTSGEGTCIIDVGGDKLGATALGRFKPYLDKHKACMQLVVNPYRPFTSNLLGVSKMITEIEAAARLSVGKIISNPNLGQTTQVQDVLQGHTIVDQIACELGLTISFLAVFKPLLQEVQKLLPKQELFPVENYLLPPWYLEEGSVNCIDPNLRLPLK